jgi:aspartyl-tRNA synthetase
MGASDSRAVEWIARMVAARERNYRKPMKWFCVFKLFPSRTPTKRSSSRKAALTERLSIKEGDLILFGADKWETACETLGRVRPQFPMGR